MIYDKNPDDQIEICLNALSTLKYALEAEVCEDSSLALTAQIIEWSLKDGLKRLQASHKEALDQVLIAMYRRDQIRDAAVAENKTVNQDEMDK